MSNKTELKYVRCKRNVFDVSIVILDVNKVVSLT